MKAYLLLQGFLQLNPHLSSRSICEAYYEHLIDIGLTLKYYAYYSFDKNSRLAGACRSRNKNASIYGINRKLLFFSIFNLCHISPICVL